MQQPADYTQRQRALNPALSFIVEAPAGSGKTELLTQRFLNLLAHCEQPEEILAITFTRKAAAEMRHRVLAALDLAEQDEPAELHLKQSWQLAQVALARDSEKQWHLRLAPHRLQIFTFDSLCARIANAMPLHSRLGGALEVSENAADLYELSIDRLLARLEQDGPLQNALAALLQHRDNNFRDLRELLSDMLARRDAWLPLLGGGVYKDEQRAYLERNLQHLIEDELQKLDGMLSLSQRIELVELIQFATGNLQTENSALAQHYSPWLGISTGEFPQANINDLALWQVLPAFLLTQEGEFRKSLTKNNGFPAGKGEAKIFKDRMLALLAEFRGQTRLQEQIQLISELPATAYPDEQWSVLSSLTTVLPMLVAQFKVTCAEQGRVDFTEISQAALSALGTADNPGDIALRMDYKINHILVDEFQDTSNSQITMLERLTSGWQRGDGRTLFCVGDAMQSIYSFRNARVSLFLHCREHGLGDIPLEPLQLSANFRSQKALVDWNNRVFHAVFPEENDITRAAVKYSPADPMLPPIDEKAVTFFPFNKEQLFEEANTIAELVKSIREKNQETTIAILLRKKAHAKHLLPALQKRGLLYQAVELETLSSTPVVRDLLALSHALLNSQDHIAWLSVLRAPWCGLSLQALEDIANAKIEDPYVRPPVLQQMEASLEKGGPRLQRVFSTLQSALTHRHRLALRQWIEGVWQELGGAACLQSDEERINAQTFFNEMEKLEELHAGSLTVDMLDSAVARLFATPNPNADGRLQIMTIHKSKGLEFDVVILPSMHSSREATDHSLIQWQDRIRENGEQELLLAPLAVLAENSEDPFFNFLKREKQRSKLLEDRRLLYVACTRARQFLYLSAGLSFDKNNSSQIQAPAKNSFLHMLETELAPHFNLAPPTEISSVNLQANNFIKHLPETWSAPELNSFTRLPELILRSEFSEHDQSLDLNYCDPTPRHIGTVFHEVLSQLVTSEHRSDIDAFQKHVQQKRNDYLARWQSQLLALGVAVKQVEAAAQRVGELLDASLSDKQFRWLLSTSHKRCLSEYALATTMAGKPVTLVLDLIVTDENGQTWIVDFKTSEPSHKQTLAAFLDAEKSAYRDKLLLYRRALAVFLQEQDSKDVKVEEINIALYFPSLPRLVSC